MLTRQEREREREQGEEPDVLWQRVRAAVRGADVWERDDGTTQPKLLVGQWLVWAHGRESHTYARQDAVGLSVEGAHQQRGQSPPWPPGSAERECACVENRFQIQKCDPRILKSTR